MQIVCVTLLRDSANSMNAEPRPAPFFLEMRQDQKKRDCTCPIWVTGSLHGKRMRKALGIRNWESAQRIVRDWEASNRPAFLPVKDAFARYIEDCEARRLGLRRFVSTASLNGKWWPSSAISRSIASVSMSWPNTGKNGKSRSVRTGKRLNGSVRSSGSALSVNLSKKIRQYL